MLGLRSHAHCQSSCSAVSSCSSPRRIIARRVSAPFTGNPHKAPTHGVQGPNRLSLQVPSEAVVSHARNIRTYARTDISSGSPASVLTKEVTNMIKGSETLEELQDVTIEWGSSFDPIHVGAAFNRAAKLAKDKPQRAWPLARQLSKIWDQLLPGASPWAIADVLWGACKLRFADVQLWRDTLERFMERHCLRAANAYDLSSVAYAVAKISLANKGEVPGVDRATLETAMLLIMDEAYVMAKSPGAVAFDVGQNAAQSVSNLVVACARVRINPGSDIMDALTKAYSRPEILGKALDINMGGFLWAVRVLMFTTGYKPKVGANVWSTILCDPLVMRRVANGRAQSLANVVNAVMCFWEASPQYITTECAQESLALLLRGRAAQNMSGLNLLDVSSVLGACALLNMHYTLQVAEHVAKSLPRLLKKSPISQVVGYRLWFAHNWLLGQPVLGGKGLGSVLTAQQLEQCKALAAKQQAGATKA